MTHPEQQTRADLLNKPVMVSCCVIHLCAQAKNLKVVPPGLLRAINIKFSLISSQEVVGNVLRQNTAADQNSI